jgi:hypothetical protein
MAVREHVGEAGRERIDDGDVRDALLAAMRASVSAPPD